MEVVHILGLVFSLLILNFIVFLLFSKVLMKTANSAMKFLIVNIAKDIIWVLAWLNILEKNNTSFLTITIIFLLGSGILYFFIIRMLNRN